jgi:hypothetical protein
MAFTVSAAQTINGIANSYETTGDGNLDDLATALSALGVSRSGNTLTFDSGGVSRIYAISGTLTEQRSGSFNVVVQNGAHVCWGYAAASTITLGKYDTLIDAPTSSVHVRYAQNALILGADTWNNRLGFCFTGMGTFDHQSGSFLYDQNSRSDLGVPSAKTNPTRFDDVFVAMGRNQGFSHTHYSSGVVTTARTFFALVGPVRVEGSRLTVVQPVATTTGIRVNSFIAGSCRLLRQTIPLVDSLSAPGTFTIFSVDPLVTYHAPIAPSDPAARNGVKRIMRTLKATARSPLGVNIPSAILAVKPLDGGTPESVTTFTGTASTELLQSVAAHQAIFSATGTGWTNTAQYRASVLAYGYPSFTNAYTITTNAGTAGVPVDAVISKSDIVTTAYAEVITAPFSFAGTTLTVSANATAKQAAEYLFKLAFDDPHNDFWIGQNHEPVTLTGTLFDFRALNITVQPGATLSGDLKTTGTVTGSVSGAIEDATGVRVTVTKSGGGNFNIAARYGTTGAYTDLGYQADISTITYTVPKGQPIEVVMWSLGYVTYNRTISTDAGGVAFAAEMTFNAAINTSLDVSSYLANIALSIDSSGATPYFVLTFNAPVVVSGIELGKAIIHRLVGQEVPLRSGMPPGSTSTIEILSDEIKNNLPALRLSVGAGLSVTDRVYLDFFINTVPALALNPAYVINPTRTDGNQVQIMRTKPTLDPATLAAAVLSSQIEVGATMAESLRLSNAVLGGKVSGAGSGTERFRNLADTKDAVVSNCNNDGNRTSVVRDLS